MSEYNDDELVPPEWLNEEFFQNVLRNLNGPGKSVKVHELYIEPASKSGDHYASIMFRAAFKYRSGSANALDSICGSKTVIIKTLPAASTEKGRNFCESHTFANELKMYTEVIPRFEEIWRSYGETIKFAGRLLDGTLSPHPVLVLEDLCLAGYDILRERLFNLNEVKACLNKLAKWHAVSYKMTTEAQQAHVSATRGVQQMQHRLFMEKNLLRSAYIGGGMRSMIAALEEAGGFEAYLPKLHAIEPHLIERCVALNNAYGYGVKGPIYVLNHGDFHTKNIMVRRGENGVLEEMLFFLWTFLIRFTICQLHIVEQRFTRPQAGRAFKILFQIFLDSLKKLQCAGELPVFEDLAADHKKWSCFEIFLVATFLSLTRLNEDKAHKVDINAIFNSAAYRQNFYRNADFIAYLRELLPYYLKEGYLD